MLEQQKPVILKPEDVININPEYIDSQAIEAFDFKKESINLFKNRWAVTGCILIGLAMVLANETVISNMYIKNIQNVKSLGIDIRSWDMILGLLGAYAGLRLGHWGEEMWDESRQMRTVAFGKAIDGVVKGYQWITPKIWGKK